MRVVPVVTYSDIVAGILSREREVRALSQAQLAAQAGMTVSPVGKIELGKSICTIEHLFKLAPAMGLKPSDILREADDHVELAKAKGFTVLGTSLDRDIDKLLADETFPLLVPGPNVKLTTYIGLNWWEVSWIVLDAQTTALESIKFETMISKLDDAKDLCTSLLEGFSKIDEQLNAFQQQFREYALKIRKARKLGLFDSAITENEADSVIKDIESSGMLAPDKISEFFVGTLEHVPQEHTELRTLLSLEASLYQDS